MNNELYHHGVLGMKWGVRRYQSYDVAPRGSGKRGKEIGEAKDGKERRGLSNKQKKALKIGAAVVGGALVAYGAYRLIKSNQSISVGKKVVEQAIGNVGKNVPASSNYYNAYTVKRNEESLKGLTKNSNFKSGTFKSNAPKVSKPSSTSPNQINLKFGDGNSKPSAFKSNAPKVSKPSQTSSSQIKLKFGDGNSKPSTFKPDTFKPDTFKPDTFEPDTFKPSSIDDDFLRNNDELLKRFRKALG